MLSKIKPYNKNAKKHPDKQLKQIANSLKEFGWQQPIIIDKKDEIIVGHGRWMAYNKYPEGIKEPWIRKEDKLTPKQVKAYRLADNKLNESDWEMDLVIEELKGLDDEHLVDLTGFDKDLLIEPDDKDDEVPEVPEEAKSKLGEIYQLGNHRIMCGDSTKVEDVEKLMDDKKADMVFTDPPYNIDFKGTLGYTSKDGKMVSMKEGYKVPNAQYEDIKNDKIEKEDFKSFINNVLVIVKEYCTGGWYICFSSSTLNELLIPLIDCEMKWKSIIIWNKNQSPMGGGHFRRKYEPIVYGYFNNLFYGKEYSEDDVWNIDRTKKNDLHPTMKPVELVTKAIGFSSNANGIVMDLFLGSGSTLIACEKTNRICYGMELDPKYVQVIIQRYEDYTNNKAIKI